MNAKLEEARKQRLTHNRKVNLLRFILRAAKLNRAQNLEVIKILFPEMHTASHDYISNCCDEDLEILVEDMFSLQFMDTSEWATLRVGYRPAGGDNA